jgi:hypothetical protein
MNLRDLFCGALCKFAKFTIGCACAVLLSLPAGAQSGFSINAVGYVDVTFVAGSNLVANPLNAGNNSISNLFRGVPDGSVFLPWDKNSATFAVSNSYHAASGWTDPGATLVSPDGGFLWLPSATQISFAGDVYWPAGQPLAACYSYPAGLSITILPQGRCGDICPFDQCPGWPPGGTTFIRWNRFRQSWDPAITYFYDAEIGFGTWFPRTPQLDVAEAAVFNAPSPFNARIPYVIGGTSAPPVMLGNWQRNGTNGSFRFAASASTGYTLLSSPNLDSWSTIQQGVASPSNGYVNLNAPIPTNGMAFYKLSSVVPVTAQPLLINSSRSGAQFQFQFYGAPGTSYTAQRKTLLTDNVWTNVVTVNGNGLITVTDNTATASSGYYRLQY